VKRASPTLPIDLAAIAIIAIGAVATYFLGVAPRRASAAAAIVDRAALADREAELSSLAERVREKRELLEAQETSLASSELKLLPSAEHYARLQAITKLAESFSLKLTQISPGEQISGKRFNIVPIRISGTSGYPDFTGFLQALHSQFEDLHVVSFNLSGRADQAAAPTFDADLAWYTSADQNARPASSGSDAQPGRATGSGLSTPAAPQGGSSR